MPLLGNPFIANAPRPMSADETIQAVRVDLAGEIEAVIGYEAHAANTTDERVKKTLLHIADEERRHVGELQQLLCVLSAREAEFVEKGRQAIISAQAQNFQAPMQ